MHCLSGQCQTCTIPKFLQADVEMKFISAPVSMLKVMGFPFSLRVTFQGSFSCLSSSAPMNASEVVSTPLTFADDLQTAW